MEKIVGYCAIAMMLPVVCLCLRPVEQTGRLVKPIVMTARGLVQGSVEVSRSGRKYLAFRSIPYAQPPVGLLRLANAKAMEPWRGLKDASMDPPYCTQYNVISGQDYDENSFFGQEDCLYLSVFTHHSDASRRRPVMVFIHGGGFESWTGAKFHGPEYFMDHDLITVFINYRLGPFGFFSMEDGIIPGNFGLRDQLMALRWVKENIVKFGGDPDSVTLFGESAGAASVHFHMKSSQSKGLFIRAIMNSGSIFSPWALGRQGVAKARAIKSAGILSCPDDDSKLFLSCLRNKTTAEIIKLRKHFAEWDTDPFVIFPPVVERPGGFFTDEDLQRATNITLLTGILAHEGAIKVAALASRKIDYPKQLMTEFNKYAPLTFGYGEINEHPEISSRVKRWYFKDQEASLTDTSSPQFLRNLTQAYSDSWFVSGISRSLMDHHGKVYRYKIERKPELSFVNLIGLKYPNGVEGPSHIDDVLFFFNISRTIPVNPLNSEDRKVSEILVSLWSNFIITGQPGGIWRPNSFGDILEVTQNGTFVTERNEDETNAKFWIELNKEIKEKTNRVKKGSRQRIEQ